MMCSDVRKVWNEHRTTSMSGRPGRNVAWDYALEKMNLKTQDGFESASYV